MFTPVRENVVALPGERPHAGWLYGSISARVEGERRLSVGTLTLGVTGPASLAEAVQTEFHRLVPTFRAPIGWDQQLPTEVAGSVSWGEQRLIGTLRASERRYGDVTGSLTGTAGTLRTAVTGEVRARAGAGLAHPWRTDRRVTTPLSVYVLAAVRTSAVARDLFLDGSTFGGSHSVAKTPLTGAWEWGVGARVARLTAEYRLIGEGREYRTGPRLHPVGVLTLSLLR